RSTQADQLPFQQIGLLQPGVPLGWKNGEIALRCQPAEDGFRFHPKEFSDRRIKPRSGAGHRTGWGWCCLHVATLCLLDGLAAANARGRQRWPCFDSPLLTVKERNRALQPLTPSPAAPALPSPPA